MKDEWVDEVLLRVVLSRLLCLFARSGGALRRPDGKGANLQILLGRSPHHGNGRSFLGALLLLEAEQENGVGLSDPCGKTARVFLIPIYASRFLFLNSNVIMDV